jgi:malonyl-CoA/methylmalonyl-CoA synthetase
VHDADPALVVRDADLEEITAAAVADDPLEEPSGAGPGDPAVMLYTSGTTGRPKGAVLSHQNLASNALALHAAWRFEPGDVLLHALPLFHAHGLFVALHTALLNASRVRFHRRFDATAVVDDLAEATVFMGVPTHYVRMLGRPELDRERCARMRLFVSGSAPLPAATWHEFERRTGHRILERYGMTETGMITSNPYDGERLPGSVGYPLPDVDVRVCDDDGAEVAPGEVGVLEVRGPNVFGGYWRLPDRTAEELRDGWFKTGDLATRAPDGRVTLVGRARDLVITGGLNVYPAEVEAVIDELPGVAESAVIGVGHPDFGEAVVAVVTAEGQAAVRDVDVIEGAAARLAPFKRPKAVRFVDALPRNAMGKVEKDVLRDRYKSLFDDDVAAERATPE